MTNVRVVTLEDELFAKRAKHHIVKKHEVKWKKAYKELSLTIIDLTSQVESLKEDLDYEINQFKGKRVKVQDFPPALV